MDKYNKYYKVEVKDIDTQKNTLTAVISTSKVDRDGDIVDPEAFKKRIKSYKEHPVLLSSHDYRTLTKQIGKAVDISVEDKAVNAKFEYFVGQGNPEADWAWFLAQKGIASFSIGFMGHAFEWIKEKDAEGNERITGRKFTDIELLEVSQVLVPSNRGALQMQAELCEMAVKGIKDDEFVIPKETKPEGHYAEGLFGAGAQATPEPQDNISDAQIKEAVSEAVSNTLKGEVK